MGASSCAVAGCLVSGGFWPCGPWVRVLGAGPCFRRPCASACCVVPSAAPGAFVCRVVPSAAAVPLCADPSAPRHSPHSPGPSRAVRLHFWPSVKPFGALFGAIGGLSEALQRVQNGSRGYPQKCEHSLEAMGIVFTLLLRASLPLSGHLRAVLGLFGAAVSAHGLCASMAQAWRKRGARQE